MLTFIFLSLISVLRCQSSSGSSSVPAEIPKIFTTAVKIKDVQLKLWEMRGEAYHYEGIAVFSENRTKTNRNCSLYVLLVPQDEKILFPTNYAKLQMLQFDLATPRKNGTEGVFYGERNITYEILHANKLVQQLRLSRIGSNFFKIEDKKKTPTYDFWISDNNIGAKGSFFTFAPPENQVELYDHPDSISMFELTAVTFPLGIIFVAVLVCVKDPRRLPGHSIMVTTVGWGEMISIGFSQGGNMGDDSGYEILFAWGLLVFLLIFIAVNKFSTKAELVTKENKTGIAFMAMIYYLATVLFFPLTKNYLPYLTSVMWIVLIFENILMTKNVLSGLMVFFLIGLQQFFWFYIYYYEQNSARIPVDFKNGVGPAILHFIFGMVAFISFFFAKNLKSDEHWNAIDFDDEKDNIHPLERYEEPEDLQATETYRFTQQVEESEIVYQKMLSHEPTPLGLSTQPLVKDK